MSQQQDYKHHARVYPPHHFVFYPLTLMATGACTWQAFRQTDDQLIWCAITLIMVLILWLSLMLRQHYSLTLQNRLIVSELRFRYYVLTQERLEAYEPKLSLPQIFALRFASDSELPALLHRAINENLTADAIKQSIKVWVPDHMRV